MKAHAATRLRVRQEPLPRRIGSTRIDYGLAAHRVSLGGSVVTIGVFDGMHLAHQALIRRAVDIARKGRCKSIVVTFDPDPQAVLSPQSAPDALMSLRERCERIADLKPDIILILPFNRRLASVSAEVFVRRILQSRLGARILIVGSDFVFGKGATGNVSFLRKLGARVGIEVVAVEPICRLGAPVSSSRVRQLVREGKLGVARSLLGRPPALWGRVVRGQGRGHHLQVPTANLAINALAAPPLGVYAVVVRYGKRSWPGVMNIGTRPTFGPGPVVCEVHLLEYSGHLYGRNLHVSLIARLRGERCFASLEALKRQLGQDIRRAKKLLLRFQ